MRNMFRKPKTYAWMAVLLYAAGSLIVGSIWGQSKVIGAGGASSPLTTKGDIWGYSTTNVRVPIGSDGFIVTANSDAAAGWDWEQGPGTLPSYEQPYIELSGGSNFGPVTKLTKPPNVSALTWVNQGGATAVSQLGGSLLMTVPSGSGDSIRFLHTSAYPTTPYTFTVGYKLWMPNSDFQGHGIAISDGTKFMGAGLGHNGVTGAVAYTFATATSDGATIGGIPITALLAGNEWYVSLTDDGTTITIKQGPDPLVMVTIGSASRASLGITPTQVGIYMDCRNASLTAQALFFHWLFS